MNPLKCRIETKQNQLCDKNKYELKTIRHGFVILIYKGNYELKQSWKKITFTRTHTHTHTHTHK